jgi:hypothetical protein
LQTPLTVASKNSNFDTPMDLTYLETTLQNLREKWPNNWPGLAVVLNSSLKKLGFDDSIKMPARHRALHDCIFSVVKAIEKDGVQRAKRQQEPRYHNRLHFADTVVALTVMLLNLRKFSGRSMNEQLSHSEWLAMLIMVSHDFLHNGQINQFRSEIEAMSVKALVPHMKKHQVSARDQALISAIILKTDPAFVAESHQLIEGQAFDLSDPKCLLVLIQECDILASSLPKTGKTLTQQLSEEWADVSPDKSLALLPPAGRLFFLKRMALFSSPASQALEIQRNIDQQIAAIEAV